MRSVALVVSVFAFAACGDDKVDADPTLYDRLGQESGIRTVITDFVGRVVTDQKINGYFLNKSVDGGRLVDCLVKQVGNASGGPQKYPDPDAGCRDMKAAHVGLGISQIDFDDLVGHLVAALTAAGVAGDDITTIASVLAPLAPDIVEDPGNSSTVYQRVGRKPAIIGVIDAFVATVAADGRINGFFAAAAGDATRLARLKTCLVRQVASIDGPIKYGEEVTTPMDPGVTAETPCADMLSSHQSLTNNGVGISIEDFNALVEDLVMVLDAGKVPTADKQALLGALGPLCPMIVKNGTGCS
jgi:truncated hemoglobin YjbI